MEIDIRGSIITLEGVTFLIIGIFYHKELFLYAFSLCKNYHLAQELTIDTFSKAYLFIDNKNHTN